MRTKEFKEAIYAIYAETGRTRELAALKSMVATSEKYHGHEISKALFKLIVAQQHLVGIIEEAGYAGDPKALAAVSLATVELANYSIIADSYVKGKERE